MPHYGRNPTVRVARVGKTIDNPSRDASVPSERRTDRSPEPVGRPTEPEPTYGRYMARYGLLALGMALATFGLLGWADSHYDLGGFWLYDNGWRPHPAHFMFVGLGLVPPAIWGVFVLEAAPRNRAPAAAADGGPA